MAEPDLVPDINDTDSDTDVDTDTDIDTDLDSDIDIDTDTDTDSDTPLIDYFTLPYTDWYDEQGRIYKDVLIKNFNAIEDKIKEINNINLQSFTIPDLSSVEYEDVSLADVETDKVTKILNLRSFLSICDIINFPLYVKTANGNKVTTVELWGSDYKYHKINCNVSATESNPFIMLDVSDYSVSNSNTFDSTKVLLAVLKDNKLVTNFMDTPGNVNFQKVLADQARSYEEYSWTDGVQEIKTDGNTNGTIKYKNQTVFFANGARKAGTIWRGGTDRIFLMNSLRDEPDLDKEDNEE